MEFQTAGEANRKALRPMAVVVKDGCGGKGTCKRLSEEERRAIVHYEYGRTRYSYKCIHQGSANVLPALIANHQSIQQA